MLLVDHNSLPLRNPMYHRCIIQQLRQEDLP